MQYFTILQYKLHSLKIQDDRSTRLLLPEPTYTASRLSLLTSDAFLNQNPVNKPAMNNRRLLIEAVFHFVHPVEKGS